MMSAVTDVVPSLPVTAACRALTVPRATYYRSMKPRRRGLPRVQRRALSADETRAVLDVVHEPRFADLAPAQVYAMLLDEGRYLCSERSIYRILAAHREVRERRNQLRHPLYAKPHVVAKRPNELWGWDITKLLGPRKWTYFYLYVVMDVFSRYVVGWMVAHRELSSLAQRLLADCCRRQNVQADQLTIHADRGTSMMSKPVALLLADLGVTKSHSRPKTSNDNPFSEAHFKTLKYRPDFPSRFGAIEHARAHCVDFFAWYNNQHHHAGIGLLTPSDVHHGLVEQRLVQRASALQAAYTRNPERFPHGSPRPPQPPSEVWINKPGFLQ
jgi:putative transposase